MNTEWNLKQLYESPKDPQIDKDIQEAKKNIDLFIKKWKSNKEYLKDPKVLKKALDEYDKMDESMYGKPLYYSILQYRLCQTDEEAKKNFSNSVNTYTLLQNSIVFFELNISKISPQKQSAFLKSRDLAKYRHFLEKCFASAKYLLSEKEENVFNLTSKTSSMNWANMLEELLNKQSLTVLNEDLKEENITYNERNKYLQSQNKKVRDFAAKEVNKIDSKYEEIAEFEINSILESKKLSDDYRNVKRADELRHISDDVTAEIVDTLVETMSSHFDIPKRYYKLKGKLLNQKNIGYHERNVPIGKQEKEYSFEESMEIVKKVFKNLDPQFAEFVEQSEKNGCYDVYPKEGKSGGAFCIAYAKSLPIFMLLNHKGTLNNVTTLAHESGHGIHFSMSRKAQGAINCSCPTSVAEVASTFFEDFVLEDILKSENNEDFKFSVKMEKLNDDTSTIFRQVAAYKFEQELHKKFREEGFLSKEIIAEIFSKHMAAYCGDTVDIDESMKLGWIHWSHFRSPFYVYSYASGLLISKGLQSLVREDPKNIEKVKEFLKSGSTLSPKDVFMKMGIDITKKEFWERGIKEIERELELLEKSI